MAERARGRALDHLGTGETDVDADGPIVVSGGGGGNGGQIVRHGEAIDCGDNFTFRRRRREGRTKAGERRERGNIKCRMDARV